MQYLGVDIGGTKIAAGIVDENGNVLESARTPTPASSGGDTVLTCAIDLARNLVAKSNYEIDAIGVGAGGQIDSDRGIVLSATDLLPGWAGQQIASRFAKAFAKPAFADNDVNAFAIGEYRFGSAHGKRSAVFLTLGTGVGGAAILDGKILRGEHWSAAELGHIIIDCRDDSRNDSGGHKGTLEAYTSGHGLVKTWQEITGDRSETTGEEIAQAALDDSGSTELVAVQLTGYYLGIGLVSIVSMFDPQVIVIGGGLSSIGDLLLDPARDVLRKRALSAAAICPVVTASLGTDSSIIGAAAAAMKAVN